MRGAVLATAGPWAAALMVGGYGLLLRERPSVTGVFVGLAALSAGQFILMTVVADRIVPIADRRPQMALQALAAGCFALSSAAALGSILGASQ